MARTAPIEGANNRGRVKLTPFGDQVRELRQEKGMMLLEMAELIGVSPGFLSMVETGRKALPDGFAARVIASLDLTDRQATVLLNAAAISAREYRIRLKEDASPLDRKLASAMETQFAKMGTMKKQQLLRLLEIEE